MTDTTMTNMETTEQLRERIVNSGRYVGAAGFLSQALNADTFEDATKTETVVKANEHLNEPMTIHDVEFADSDKAGAVPFYATCDVTFRSTGERTKLRVGGARVVVTLLRASEKGWFPLSAKLTSVGVGEGQSALNLVPVSD